MKTERLYELDAYCKAFEASVISCEKNGEYYDVVLDKTAFFPEGGGQSPDEGKIGDANVLDVTISDGVITHKTDKELTVGATVLCELDWELRFVRMQNHSGEHILSGIVHSLFGYTNVGFHMSKSEMTVDFNGVLSREDIEKVEKLTNYAIYRNLPITVSYPTKEESKKLFYRSKLDDIEDLRLVTIEDIDCCACCAPHVRRTGEIGLVKVIDSTPNKGGIRLTVSAGYHAFLDYSKLNATNKSLMNTLSVPRDNVAEASARNIETINSLRFENQELLKRLAWSELCPIEIGKIVCAFTRNLSYEELRHCSNKLLEQGKEICMLFSTSDDENYIYVISSAAHDTKPIVKSLNETFGGKGGGKPNYAQGKIVSDSTDAILAFAKKIQ